MNDKIAIYLRLSLADGDLKKGSKDESNSIENQRMLLHDYIGKQEDLFGEIVEYVDDGYTGTNFNRPAFQEALELVNQGRVRNFVVKDLSRFGRDYLKVGAFTEVAFPEKNVRFIAINDNVDSEKPEDNSLAPFCNLFNEWYARDCSKKITAVKHVKESYEWVVDEAARPVIQRIFHDYASGKSMSQIASEHVDDKILTPADHKMKLGIKVNKITSQPYGWNSQIV